jgi:hypothetical protein
MKTAPWVTPDKSKLNLYVFRQNNSGGRFREDDVLAVNMVIEANSEEQAMRRGGQLGIYFDGVRKGIDCDCCGDRWYTPDVLKFPMDNWNNESKSCNDFEDYMKMQNAGKYNLNLHEEKCYYRLFKDDGSIISYDINGDVV